MNQLLSCNDLFAEEVIYLKKWLTNCNLNKIRFSGRSVRKSADIDVSTELEIVCNCLEEDGDFEFYTLNELQEKMEESVSKYYPNTHLKQKLEEKYGDHIFFFSSNLPKLWKIRCCVLQRICQLYCKRNEEKAECDRGKHHPGNSEDYKSEIREIPKSN